MIPITSALWFLPQTVPESPEELYKIQMPDTLPLEASFKLVWTGVQALMCFKLSPVDSNVQPRGATS